MSDPFFPFRNTVELYFRACENLIAAGTIPPPLTQQELAMIGHYAAEIQNFLAASTRK